MSYLSAEGLPVTYSQATITNADSTETLLINTNSVQVVAGSDLNLGSLGDATQLVLAPGQVTSNTPFEVVSAAANIQVNNGTSTLLLNPTEAVTTASVFNLGTNNAIQLAVTPTELNAYAPYVPMNLAYPIAAIAGQYPVGYTSQPVSGTISVALNGGIKTIGTITPQSVGVWLVTATIQCTISDQDIAYLSLSGTNGTLYQPSIVSAAISDQFAVSTYQNNLLSTCVFPVTTGSPNVYILATSLNNTGTTTINNYTYTITRIA
jgi:hypothetical protein